MSYDQVVRSGIGIAMAHGAIVGIHGLSHARLGIGVTQGQAIYIAVIIFIAPLVAAVSLRRAAVAGFLILMLSMFGALVFGLTYHFILPGPDNVFEVHHRAWAMLFQFSALFLALTEAAGTALGATGLLLSIRKSRRA